MLAAVLYPFAIGALGLGSWPYDITLDRISIPAQLVSFPPVTTMVVLAFPTTMQVLAPLVMTGSLRNRLRTVEERLILRSWHLRQLSRRPEPREREGSAILATPDAVTAAPGQAQRNPWLPAHRRRGD